MDGNNTIVRKRTMSSRGKTMTNRVIRGKCSSLKCSDDIFQRYMSKLAHTDLALDVMDRVLWLYLDQFETTPDWQFYEIEGVSVPVKFAKDGEDKNVTQVDVWNGKEYRFAWNAELELWVYESEKVAAERAYRQLIAGFDYFRKYDPAKFETMDQFIKTLRVEGK